MNIKRFSVMVNCCLPDENEMTDSVQDFSLEYEDHGVILLPESYTDAGRATTLVISCHGAGGTVSSDDSQMEHQPLTKYLAANGYAVMDVNGLPHEYAEKNGIDLRNNIGSPIALRSYVKAYRYCMDNFNLCPDVFVLGASMGGISSTNLVLSGAIPVIAHAAACPVLDTYNEIFLHPWSDGLPKTALGKIYRFETDESGGYLYDEAKLIGFNPVKNRKAVDYPVPVKFWHCVDDPTVSYAVTKKFIDAIRENGGIAYLRSLPHGGHEPYLVGEPVKDPSGCDMFDGEKIEILPVVDEVLVWFRNFT